MYDVTISEMLTDIHEDIVSINLDVAVIKTDIVWIKRIVSGVVVVVGTLFGLDMSGVL